MTVQSNNHWQSFKSKISEGLNIQANEAVAKALWKSVAEESIE